ncbi:MAG: hypothetical protein GX445_08930 [Elusimicrobia bacterium]|nr:hypothetical protein [Elusimicrobiota bacterium]
MARMDLYQLLVNIASRQERILYGEVSERLQDHPNPHIELSNLLYDVNRVCADFGLPPISALVVSRDRNSQIAFPENGFWHCSAVANLPTRHLPWLERYI